MRPLHFWPTTLSWKRWNTNYHKKWKIIYKFVLLLKPRYIYTMFDSRILIKLSRKGILKNQFNIQIERSMVHHSIWLLYQAVEQTMMFKQLSIWLLRLLTPLWICECGFSTDWFGFQIQSYWFGNIVFWCMSSNWRRWQIWNLSYKIYTCVFFLETAYHSFLLSELLSMRIV